MYKAFNKKEFIVFIIIFIVTLIIFIPFLQKHYATDSYNIFSIGYKEYAINNSLNDGRVVMALISYIAYLLKIPLDIYILTVTIMALFINCISIINLKNYILKIKKRENIITEILVLLISYFTIFNFMYIENMIFVECFVMSLSILLYILAAEILINKEKNYIIKSGLLLIFGILCYQGTISMYLISLLLFTLLKNEKYKDAAKHYIKGIVILILGIVIQFLIIKANEKLFNIQQERLSDSSAILRNIVISLKYLYSILVNTGYVYTKYLYLFFVAVIEILVIFKVYKERVDINILKSTFLLLIFSILFGLSVSFISGTGFWSARIRFSIGASIGIILLYMYCKTDLFQNFKKIINLFIILAFIIYSLSIIINYVSIMNNTLRINKADKTRAIEVNNYIQNYEEHNNIKVNKIAIFYGSFNNKAFYYNLKYIGSAMSWSAIRTEWSIKGIIEMYSNRKFESINPNEEDLIYYIYNADKDKDYMCINDVLYISYYVY